MRSKRSILFLQGTASPFFSALSSRLADSGCLVYRVNFCGGDWFFDKTVNKGSDWNFQQPLAEFAQWIAEKFARYHITDIILFGDARPVHQDAIKLARLHGIRIHVYEEGYLRPNRITLDKDGVNAASSLPNNPAWYYKQGGKFPEYPADDTGGSLWIRAWHDLRYHLASFVMRRQFPHYSTHRPESPLREYLGWVRRFPTLLFHDWNGNRIIRSIIKKKTAYYFLPLQLSADTQIRIHSPFSNVTEVIVHTIQSFAKNAPADSLLVIKNHPLDTGLVNYRKIIKKLGNQLGIKERLVYLEDGYLPTMVHHSKGVVLVNSTVGTSALFHRRPTCVLGEAIYNMEGLTYQGGLDSFWTEGQPPRGDLFYKFCNAIIHLTQINGDFYSKKGIEMSVQGSLRFFGLAQDLPVVEPENKVQDIKPISQTVTILPTVNYRANEDDVALQTAQVAKL